MMPTPIVELRGITKDYRLDSIAVPALREIDLAIQPNCFTVIAGTSGSGKTTLLNLIGCIDKPDAGRITVAGHAVLDMDDEALSAFRLHHLGFVFQNFNLVPVLTAHENIEYPLILAKHSKAQRAKRVRELLDAVGLGEKAAHRPGQLSGGQRQRVAIARALAMSPRIVLADEPTANLDSRTGMEIIQLMRRMQREQEVSFIFSSHDSKVLDEADEVVHLMDGRIHAREAQLAPVREAAT
jgi:putative ABC transport system ATP-binding protein